MKPVVSDTPTIFQDTIQVIGADIVDGLLVVALENNIPEEDKPQIIKLGKLNKAASLLLG